ncbi:hypothetical protein TGGT1_366630 [Toxoplasma gondii GT1]|uniref:Uncharacterized protein n=3 Tax=Toxoplasma gondii TaxID=5811 RepID=S7W6I4_TOXGG|nr:hypothetical protein TGGT1_366630 [Toxoplasma gondii GT1]KFH14735.1 hypothetical protein TGMAS_366630 [Toxoplasma gondii MAS]PIM05659.1 hypothetical protein TGCOUG_366630 [Toxoplasma gondii COUG]
MVRFVCMPWLQMKVGIRRFTRYFWAVLFDCNLCVCTDALSVEAVFTAYAKSVTSHSRTFFLPTCPGFPVCTLLTCEVPSKPVRPQSHSFAQSTSPYRYHPDSDCGGA